MAVVVRVWLRTRGQAQGQLDEDDRAVLMEEMGDDASSRAASVPQHVALALIRGISVWG